MTRISILLIGITLTLLNKPIYAATNSNPFTATSAIYTSTGVIKPAKFISLNGHITSNKVLLQWLVSENETADQFEVEKSSDGKNFFMAALVFGTDKPATDQYEFYEKANGKKISYRIKLINKDHQTVYSSIIEIGPGASNQN